MAFYISIRYRYFKNHLKYRYCDDPQYQDLCFFVARNKAITLADVSIILRYERLILWRLTEPYKNIYSMTLPMNDGQLISYEWTWNGTGFIKQILYNTIYTRCWFCIAIIQVFYSYTNKKKYLYTGVGKYYMKNILELFLIENSKKRF